MDVQAQNELKELIRAVAKDEMRQSQDWIRPRLDIIFDSVCELRSDLNKFRTEFQAFDDRLYTERRELRTRLADHLETRLKALEPRVAALEAAQRRNAKAAEPVQPVAQKGTEP